MLWDEGYQSGDCLIKRLLERTVDEEVLKMMEDGAKISQADL